MKIIDIIGLALLGIGIYTLTVSVSAGVVVCILDLMSWGFVRLRGKNEKDN